MTDICERRVIHLPEDEAASMLASFVARHQAGDGTVRIALRLPLVLFAKWSSLIERSGVADFYALRSGSDQHPTYSVTWSARDGGLFPFFSGALAVEDLSRADRFGLILSGHYEPPLGRFGAAFDALVGRNIARATARDLLRSIGYGVQRLSAGPAASHEDAGAEKLSI